MRHRPFWLALDLLRHPPSGGRAIAAQPDPPGRLFVHLILPGATVSALAATAGVAWFNRDWNADFGYSAPPQQALAIGLAVWLFSTLYPLLLAWVFARCAALYRGGGNYAAALALAAHGTVPVWIAGACLFFMPAVLLGMPAFLYACLLYSNGASTLLGVREDDTAQLVAVTLLLTAILMSALGMAGAALRIL